MTNVLVNGGSRGIGAEIVRLFCKKGYKVAFTYSKSIEKAIELQTETGAYPIMADSRSEEQILQAIHMAHDYFGDIDILVNNAAISNFSQVQDISLEMWEEMLFVNLTAPFLYARESVKDMIKKKEGRIINIASIWGEVGASCESHYSASKGGLIAFTKALAKEVGPSGITVNAVSPGVINTDMNGHLSKEDYDSLIEETPLLRIGQPQDIANAVFYLASEEASFVTGTNLSVNGGFS